MEGSEAIGLDPIPTGNKEVSSRGKQPPIELDVENLLLAFPG
jgi:hypothetical protein